MNNAFRARRLPVALTIIAALMLAIVPLPPWAEAYWPDWVAITLIYWCLHMPRHVGVGSGWIVGIVLDVAQGTLLGQHALALSLIAYLTVKFHLQLRVFPMSQMAATVLGLLGIYRFVLFWINGVAGVDAPLVAYWGPVVTGALIWPVADFVLRTIPRRRRPAG